MGEMMRGKENICIKNLSKSLGGKVVFDGLNLTIKGGATTCIMAPSGAGKTTLLRILMGLETADGGSVTGLDGKRFSAVFQEERLCENMSAADNIRLVMPSSTGMAAMITEMDRIGLCSCAGQSVSELSGGMRRRVSILRALLAEYDVLFLDEPFKGLDEALKGKVIAYVKEKTAGKTVVFVTHDKTEARIMEAEIVELIKQ